MEIFKTLVKASLKSQAGYKFNFILDIFSSGIIFFSDFLIIAVILTNFKSLGGWTLHEVAILISIIDSGWAIYRTFGEGLERMQELLQTGRFDTLLIRPISTLKHLMIHAVQFRRLGILVQAIIVGSWGIINSGVFSLPFIILYIFLVILAGILILEINIVLAAVAFWTLKNDDLLVLTVYATKTAASYPLNIFNPFLKNILTFVIPLGTITYFPISFVLGKTDNITALLAPFLSVVLMIPVCSILWKTGLKKYTGTGS